MAIMNLNFKAHLESLITKGTMQYCKGTIRKAKGVA